MQMNHTAVIGRLTRDPETRSIGADKIVASLSIAVNRVFNTGGEKKEETMFLDVETFGNSAASVGKYCYKGLEVLVEGYLKQDNWEDKSGNKRSKIKLVARSVQWSHTGQNNDAGGGQDDYQRQPVASQSNARPSAPSSDIGDEPPFYIDASGTAIA